MHLVYTFPMNPRLSLLEALRDERSPHLRAAADLLDRIKAIVLELLEEGDLQSEVNIRQLHLASGVGRPTIYAWLNEARNAKAAETSE